MEGQQAVLNTLLIVYAGAVLINSLVAGLLWLRQRDALTRAQLFIWGSTFGSLVVQGLAGTAMPLVLVGLTAVFSISCAIAHLLSISSDVVVSWRRSFYLLGLGWVVALLSDFAGLPFFFVTFPLLCGVAFPLLSTAGELLLRHRARLSSSELGMVVASLFYGLHMLDFALLGDKPEWGPFGFSLGLLCIFALSIFAPAVVVEKITAQTARTAAEMDAARRIQTQLLPHNPQVPGLELVCYMKPADEVGGDYYDVQRFGDRAWILLGDVTGHGLSSGLVMLMAQSVMSSILRTRESIGPGELNLLANSVLHQNLARMGEERTMSIVSLCMDRDDELVLSGSHDNLYVHRKATGEVEVVTVSQFPFQLGLIEDIPADFVSETRLHIEPGDTLFVITDGVTEAAKTGDYKQGMFEEARLIEFIKRHASRPLEAIRAALTEDLERFTQGVYHDDVTFIIARRQEA
ncbi:SpoIIE family protein phosphatase [Myxococcota bacterium]|nr:SpoIIE family protein phosphatase [Myxococcota bacterium]